MTSNWCNLVLFHRYPRVRLFMEKEREYHSVGLVEFDIGGLEDGVYIE